MHSPFGACTRQLHIFSLVDLPRCSWSSLISKDRDPVVDAGSPYRSMLPLVLPAVCVDEEVAEN